MCSRFRLADGSCGCCVCSTFFKPNAPVDGAVPDLGFFLSLSWSMVNDLARAHKYFPRGLMRPLDGTRFCMIQCLHFCSRRNGHHTKNLAIGIA
jgi:hypothetical protein